ncbi:hypothetical protein ACFFJX_24965 [Pseudarcicella hirudinis]|uniref:hypothetical protein n=1 Tax=Pseudarcicella hirudinis TaxID=1079859 RepID=UPI0035E5E3F3
MFSILRQPYPHSESPRKRLILSVAAGIFIAGFLDIFQPFGSSGWNNPYKLILLANFGLVTTAIMLGNFFMLTWLFPRFFKEENWTVGREIFFTVFNVLSIALGNILYGHYIGLFIIAGVGMLSMVSYTFLIGVFPSTGIAFINYIYHLKQYNHPPQPSVERVEKEDVLIKLIAENEKDSISLYLLNYCSLNPVIIMPHWFMRKTGRFIKN